MKQLYRATTMVALLFAIEGCSTPVRDVVLPRIDDVSNWSLDNSGWLTYQESAMRPSLSILISPHVRPESQLTPLVVEFVVVNNFDATISLEPTQMSLKIGDKRYTASVVDCRSSTANPEQRAITMPKLLRGQMAPHICFRFDAAQIDDWIKVSLRMDGLFKNGEKILAPEIRFYKTKRGVPGSFG